MQSSPPTLGTENQSPYQVDSRREIIALLRGLKDSNQLVSMMINGGSEMFITSILEVDDVNNSLIIDSAQGQDANQRIVEAPRVSFEGLLDRISIQFSSSGIQRTTFDNRPALQLNIPTNVIRLQRREYYRINTPLSNPIRCMIGVEDEGILQTVKFSLVDISCGGIAILDEKKLLSSTIGTLYDHCKIDFPGIGLIDVDLQIRNAQDLILLNGKSNRRLGCQFINLSSSVLASIQRYIMKLERERNSKLTGIR
ncbi:flagellar brake protein [Undibacterium sp. Jales W-56]|uniref:flagellar brake protein n=1 Tax=Undibacterium sp. Jales W-56 TaxID=2897325 RepID=UPI0021D374C3|nr:flagellar brake protein [Undibacterium sp. Jales W-56]MCU6435384.1 flagellar brake protein [Undibacterium sp. Jales W-56]